eukprot:g15332.t1
MFLFSLRLTKRLNAEAKRLNARAKRLNARAKRYYKRERKRLKAEAKQWNAEGKRLKAEAKQILTDIESRQVLKAEENTKDYIKYTNFQNRKVAFGRLHVNFTIANNYKSVYEILTFVINEFKMASSISLLEYIGACRSHYIGPLLMAVMVVGNKTFSWYQYQCNVMRICAFTFPSLQIYYNYTIESTSDDQTHRAAMQSFGSSLNETSSLEVLSGKINALLYILNYCIEDLEKIVELYSHFLRKYGVLMEHVFWRARNCFMRPQLMAMLLMQNGQNNVTRENMNMVLNEHLQSQNIVIDNYYLNATKSQFNGLFISKKSSWGSFNFNGTYGKRVYKTAKELKLFANDRYFELDWNAWIEKYVSNGGKKSSLKTLCRNLRRQGFTTKKMGPSIVKFTHPQLKKNMTESDFLKLSQ